MTSIDEDGPKNIQQLSSSASNMWKKIKDEMESMKIDKLWNLVDFPKVQKTISNKWILKVKRKVDSTIKRYKTRLVAKKDTQQEGINYE